MVKITDPVAHPPVAISAGDRFPGVDISDQTNDVNGRLVQFTIEALDTYLSETLGYLKNLSDDNSPQLGAELDVNGFNIVSSGGGDIALVPDGTGNVRIGNYVLDADQVVGASEDNYVLTYDHSIGLVRLEVAPGSGGGISWSDPVTSNILPDTDSLRNIGANGNEFAEIHTDVLFVGGQEFAGDALADPDGDRLVAWIEAGNSTEYVTPTNGIEFSGTDLRLTENVRKEAIEVVIGQGGGGVVLTGWKVHYQVPWDCTITRARLLVNTPSDTTIDIWKDTYANYPPENADSICGGNELSVASPNMKAEDATLTGWTTALSAGDILAFNVDANNNAVAMTIVLEVLKT